MKITEHDSTCYPWLRQISMPYCHYVKHCNNLYVIRKTPSLPKTLKVLLPSLSVSDVSVGLLGPTSHFWSCGYNTSILAVINTRECRGLGSISCSGVVHKCRQVLSYSSSFRYQEPLGLTNVLLPW